MGLERMRIDLDGVELKDASGRVVCILRWRTVNGLVLKLPESVDVTVPWNLVAEVPLDLMSGTVKVKFTPEAKKTLSWLQAGTELSGQWTDRHVLTEPPKR